MNSAPRHPVLLLAFGETEDLAHEIVARRFPGAAAVVLPRASLRRPGMSAIRTLMVRSYGDVVLVVPSLTAPRARLLAVFSALARVRRHWVADGTGRFEPWTLGSHLQQYGRSLASHLLTCAAALVLARPAFALLGASLNWRGPFRRPRPRHRAGRILYLRSQFWVGLKGGGSVAHTAGVIGGLRAAGVQVQVVSSDRLHGVQGPIEMIPPNPWFDGKLREVEEVAFNVPFALAAWRIARIWRPDALYQRYAAFNVAGVLLARLLGIPLILEFNSSDVWKGAFWGGMRWGAVGALGEQVNLRGADLVVVVSTTLRDDLVRLGIDGRKIVINPNGVDPEVFHPDADTSNWRARLSLENKLVAGFSGTFGVWHGIPTLAKALPLLARELPNLHLLLFGDGPLRLRLEEAVDRAHLRDRVTFLGMVPHEEMPGCLAACDILLSPHGRQVDGGEFFGSPTKLFEYMAAGRPIVASAVGQIAQVLVDGETALLVPPDDASALVGAVSRLAKDPALRARLGAAARVCAEAEHTWVQNARVALEALNSLPLGNSSQLTLSTAEP